jgi:UDP-glucose 4-epimerase
MGDDAKERGMNILIFGGCGFVGLNIAATALAKGHHVMLFDRSPVPAAALAHFAPHGGRFRHIAGDVTDATSVRQAVTPGTDIVILGAAITAGPAREASDPASILAVNLLAHLPILEASRDACVRRVINLSSVAAYGLTGEKVDVLTEDAAMEPVGLYAITKWASERVGARVGGHWGLDFVSLRLSAVFGPWEHVTSVRDTPSPQFQVLKALAEGRPAVLARPGTRDWIYAVDVAEAVLATAGAKALPRKVYNVTAGQTSSVLDWGQAMLPGFGGGTCRLAAPGETPTINLYGPADRAPMSGEALAGDTGWRARFDTAASAAHLSAWRRDHGDISLSAIASGGVTR